MQLTDFINVIQEDAPLDLALDWDKSGIQVAAEKKDINTVGIGLDPSLETVEQAINLNCDFLLCHHPLCLRPRMPDKIDSFHRILSLLLRNDIWLYSAHTSLDVNPRGPAGWLARELHLENCRTILPTRTVQSETLSFDPPLHVDRHELPMASEIMEIVHAQKKILRVVVPRGISDSFLAKLEEEIGFFPFERRPGPGYEQVFGLGLMGSWKKKITFFEFMKKLEHILDLERVICAGKQPEYVQKVAYCPGSGGELGAKAFGMGADIFISGDLKYHQAQELEALGFTLDVGHFILEEKMMLNWCEQLNRKTAGVSYYFIKGRTPLHVSDVHALKNYSGEG